MDFLFISIAQPPAELYGEGQKKDQNLTFWIISNGVDEKIKRICKRADLHNIEEGGLFFNWSFSREFDDFFQIQTKKLPTHSICRKK